ncbi:hypothetical protein [Nocardia macrotermitis]|uniref:hypothetical protein n=1 Tax=Nocardia macrotermitis TaxID=2585198 RepID=UPI0012968296|nr:hypothetical protein [Nocardia macrotermitis]
MTTSAAAGEVGAGEGRCRAVGRGRIGGVDAGTCVEESSGGTVEEVGETGGGELRLVEL